MADQSALPPGSTTPLLTAEAVWAIGPGHLWHWNQRLPVTVRTVDWWLLPGRLELSATQLGFVPERSAAWSRLQTTPAQTAAQFATWADRLVWRLDLTGVDEIEADWRPDLFVLGWSLLVWQKANWEAEAFGLAGARRWRVAIEHAAGLAPQTALSRVTGDRPTNGSLSRRGRIQP